MREILLTNNKIALVDDGDFETLSRFKWTAYKKRSTWYAHRTVHASERELLGGRKSISMHRFLLSHLPTKGIEIDHKNRNGLDNQRENLRVATRSLNQMNCGPYKGNKSGYKGVSWRQKGRVIAQIYINTRRVYLGRFDTPEQAARAYDAKAKELFGEFAYLNFPEG
jgi:AP2 domain.